MKRAIGAVAMLLACVLPSAMPSLAQNQGRVARDFETEGKSLEACRSFSFGNLTDCGQTLIMGQPMHIAVGSLSPDNGFGAGLAFVEHKDYASEWRANWNVDALATDNGSWRAGGYMKAYILGGRTPHLELPAAGSTVKKHGPFFTVSPLFYLYSETTSLNRVDYFGLGPNTSPAAHTTFGFTENVTGVNAALPVRGSLQRAGLAVVAEANGRFPSVRAGSDASLPSIGKLFTEATAPGLTRQSAFAQLSEGLRIDPQLFKKDWVRLDYLVQFQQFIAADGGYSFRRFNGDFSHEIPLYSFLPPKLAKAYTTNRSPQFQNNGPDDCTGTNTNISPVHAATAKKDPARPCPALSTLGKLEGSITLRTFLSESIAGKGNSVPFYFSPTIGGSDIDSTSMLSSYPDYRFRGPDLLLFRGTLEHSLGKLPVGVMLSADEGKIGLDRGDIGIDHLRHTFSVGFTVRAGGLPVANLLFSWGGREGTHTAATVNPSLLGGSARPSLF